METLLKMMNVFSWIAVIACPLIVTIKIYLEFDYSNSLDKSMDRLNGIQRNYISGIGKWIVSFIVALVFLIVY